MSSLYSLQVGNRSLRRLKSGKRLVPFSTHEGSGLSGFDKKLESACPNSTILVGLAIRGNDCQNKQDSVRSEVSDWLKGLGY